MTRHNLKKRIATLTKSVDDSQLATKIQAMTSKIRKLETRMTNLISQGKPIGSVIYAIEDVRRRIAYLGKQLNNMPTNPEQIAKIKQLIEHLTTKLSQSIYHRSAPEI